MKQCLRPLLLISVLLMMCSCAAGIPYAELNPSLRPEAPETGRIFFYRPAQMGMALTPEIMVNGESVGRSRDSNFFFIDTTPGKYEVITSTEVKRKVSFMLDEDQTRYIRFKVGMGFFVGHVYGELVDPDEALPELQKCKYYVEEMKDTQ